MARTNVIISDSTNPAYDGKLATTNGFYQVEDWNLGCVSPTAPSLATNQVISTTFRNAGNCQGVVLCICSQSITQNKSIITRLEQTYGAVTFDVSADTVLITGHGLLANQAVSFSSTGTLPTGITANTVYFVRSTNLLANSFEIATAAGGAKINLSGTPSGTHTMWVEKAIKTLTSTEIHGDFTLPSYAGYDYSTGFVPFKFDTPYAVDTSSNKWRFNVWNTGASGNWNLVTSNGTVPFYATWCDTQVTATDNDTMGICDPITINKSLTLSGILGTGVTDYAMCGFACRNTDYSIDNVCNLVWENPPVSKYTFTLKGQFYLGNHSGFRAGTEENPIPYSQMGTLASAIPNVGTNTTSGFRTIPGAPSTSYCASKCSFFIYGEIPSTPFLTLAQNANFGQAVLNTVEDIPADWVADDYVAIGKQDVVAQGDATLYQIGSVGTKQITLKTNMALYNRIAGGHIIRFNGYGFRFQGVSNTNYLYNYIGSPSNYTVKGVEKIDCYDYVHAASYYYCLDDLPYRSKYSFTDVSARCTGNSLASNTAFFSSKLGLDILRNYCFRCTVTTAPIGYRNANMQSGVISIKDNICIVNYTGSNINPASGTMPVLDVQNNIFENSGRYGCHLSGLNLTFKNNKFWGVSASYGSGYQAIRMAGVIQPKEISGNTVDKSGVALKIAADITIGCVDKGMVFGAEAANTHDVQVESGANVDYEIRDAVNISVIDTSAMPDSVDGSKLRFTNYNSVANDDRVYTTYGNFQRCGTGQTDTNSRSGYSLRFEPTSTENVLLWKQTVPTGDISGKTMGVTCWVKIASSAYYAGTHTNPILRVKYDDATEVTAVASDSTDWQQLRVEFEPSTTFGQIVISVEGATDALATDAYFYLDDLSPNYPDGVAPDLCGLNLWANALPITPTVSLVPSMGTYSLDDIYAKLNTLLTEDTFIGLSE